MLAIEFWIPGSPLRGARNDGYGFNSSLARSTTLFGAA
jgi:hypothetical protein